MEPAALRLALRVRYIRRPRGLPPPGRHSAELDSVRGTGGNHAFYLSIPPSYFPVVAKHLSDTGLNKRQGREWRRVIIEKPFGHNLESARELSDVISQIFDEQDVFRIDHYLGKETVQNILAMRFSNQMFEPPLELPLRGSRPDHPG